MTPEIETGSAAAQRDAAQPKAHAQQSAQVAQNTSRKYRDPTPYVSRIVHVRDDGTWD